MDDVSEDNPFPVVSRGPFGGKPNPLRQKQCGEKLVDEELRRHDAARKAADAWFGEAVNALDERTKWYKRGAPTSADEERLDKSYADKLDDLREKREEMLAA